MVSVFMITAFRRPLSRGAFGALAAFLCLATSACDRVALLAPAGSTIRLTALTSTLPLSGSTSIIAHVIEPAGTPPQRGTLVTFTTTMGSIAPIEAETDAGGRVLVTFNAGTQSGTATITALSGGVIVDTASTLKIAIGAAGVTNIGLTALPATIAPGGTSTITATVSDATGTVVAGIPVTFTTDNGSMDASVVMTDTSGKASAVLNTSKTAKVTASAGVASTNGTTTTPAPSASVTVTVEPLPTASIAASGNAQVNLPVTFTITAQPGTGGSTTVENVTVNFGDGSSTSLGAATGTSTVQHVYTSDGPKTARVTVRDSNGGTTSAATIVFVQTQAPIVSLTYTSTPGVVTTAVNFTATVTPSGTSVAQYVWNFGDGQSQTTFTNTVSHNYATATLPRTATVTITTTTNQTASASTTVTP
jgi:mucin-2